ncbi:MAG TPA: nucleotidyltransferase family protein [Micropepsaceae bacterium]|nr:nucleotidyltransferase family protein [Micropepsaceae bacterium]
MESDEVIARLKKCESQLRARGVRSLGLFGSTARGQANPGSDVDVLIELENGRHITLLDLSDIKFSISELLGTRVDVAIRKSLRPSYRASIERDVISVF